MLPVPAVKVRLLFPLTVLEKVMVPAPAPVDTEVVPVKLTARRKEAAVFAVRIVPDKETAPAPF